MYCALEGDFQSPSRNLCEYLNTPPHFLQSSHSLECARYHSRSLVFKADVGGLQQTTQYAQKHLNGST